MTLIDFWLLKEPFCFSWPRATRSEACVFCITHREDHINVNTLATVVRQTSLRSCNSPIRWRPGEALTKRLSRSLQLFVLLQAVPGGCRWEPGTQLCNPSFGPTKIMNSKGTAALYILHSGRMHLPSIAVSKAICTTWTCHQCTMFWLGSRHLTADWSRTLNDHHSHSMGWPWKIN